MAANSTDSRSIQTRTDVATRASRPGAFGIAGAVALGVMAAGQLANLAHERVDTGSAEALITEPHDLSDLAVRLEDGTVTQLSGGGPTLLLVFDAQCPHSERIAPSWTTWLSDHRPKEIRALGVSAGPLAAGVRYARAKQWPVELGTLDSPGEGLVSQAVTKRTPWVFAVNHDGRVVAEGHGSQLAEVARLLGEYLEARTR